VAHAYNFSYSGGRDEKRLQFETSLGKKVLETPPQPIKLGMVAYACHVSYTGGINRRITV
jgi:hypothetical protein